MATDSGKVVSWVLGRPVVWGSREWSLVHIVVPWQLARTERDFLVESAESLDFHLSLGETCLHLLIRLLEVHDVVSGYEEVVRTVDN